MDVEIRPLMPDDIRRVAEIERQAFPTLWPPTPFDRELGNRLARYLVAWDPSLLNVDDDALNTITDAPDQAPAPTGRSIVDRMKGALMERFASRHSPTDNTPSPIMGFVGLWFTEGAHITGIAVEESWRGRGIGELLLMASIDLAMQKHSTVVTLEARISNYIAQALYEKYGFENVGIMKGYYTDNREDAVKMSTPSINTSTYQSKFLSLKEAYELRNGDIKITLSS